MPFQKGNSYGGRRSARSSQILRPASPQREEDDASDEEMRDVEDGEDDTVNGTPREAAAAAGDDDEDDDEDDAATPAQDDDDDEADSPPTVTLIPRKRGRGRPPGSGRYGSRRATRGDSAEGGDNDASESGTPFRRKRGRPVGSGRGGGRGGFRGRRKGVQPEAPRVVDKEGNVLDVVNDEAVVDDDDEGNTKVDEDGQLLGGREYRVRTFTVIGRGERLYMLSTEPARCCGFRDSYLFFTKHPKLYKVLLSDEEKRDLIDREILPSSYKGRNIGVVTARSVFREFGARIIVGGRRITDDYKVTEAREAGEVEGELADPEDKIPEKKEDYNRNRYVAWHGASEVYRSSGPVGGGAVAHPGKPGPVGKRRNNITLQNWQHLHAKEASRFNATLVEARRANLDGVYDANTNLMLFPKIMQPTHARWEWVPPSTGTEEGHDEKKRLTNGTEHANHTSATIFPPVPPVVSRNFTVLDTYFSSPPILQPGYPGPDGQVADPSSGPNGLSSISDELVAELPEACRRAFEIEREKERAWKGQWGAEAQSGSRGQIRIGLVGHPV